MKIKVNPDTQASTGFGYALEGEYTLRVVACAQAQGKQYPYLKWTFEFADPNVKATENGKKVGQIFENTTLKEDSQWGIRAVTDALGIEWKDFDTDEVKGLEFQAKVGVEEYQGQFNNKVKKYVPAK